MSDEVGKHVFISYVREDSDQVDGLCAVLEAAQIPYWRDRKDLGPGDAWRAKIRAAIRDGSLVFLACFSDNSRAKARSYMNEELTLAVEEFRQMPPGRVWLIPVRFDAGDVPGWDLGAGRVLSDLNYSDLFGRDHTAHAARLVTTINRLLGEKRPDLATALAAVEQATSADRADLLKRLTKEMLLEPSRRIELDDLVSQEVQRVLAVLKNAERLAGQLDGTNEEQIVRIAEEAQDLWTLSEPFCASLQVACRWGAPESLQPWTSGIRSFVAAATRPESGTSALVELRHLPGMVGIMTAALACASSGNWANLKSMVIDPSVRDRYGQKPTPIVEATDPNKPFGGTTDYVTNTLARASATGRDLGDSLKDFTERRNGKYHTPVAEWLHHVLRPIFSDQWSDDDAYSSEFDRAEVVLGVLAQDVVNVRAAANPQKPSWRHSRWYGRSTWRSESHGNPIADLAHEFDTQGAQWGPLASGLFGGNEDRARAALEAYQTSFYKIAGQQF
ncbi:toll/interleukin-1 receptor domain-containing protein [Streptomyces apocyni]|uniref:toll/interleukin-1 receptor domain-containing protein n=1 Tax=Streptomyces apocyni TaxID=2654677 RepID=UPI0012E993E0|nr:toll/interleukin-1 receptor domain-containing protein [Streptomyces apocyni]